MPETSVLRRIEAAFGHARGFPRPTFYAFENALRFDLGGDVEAMAPRFLQAIDRARKVARAIFSASGALTAVVSYHSGERRTRRDTRWPGILDELGFSLPFGKFERLLDDEDGHQDLFGYWQMADFRNDPALIDALLWGSIAREMRVTPWARWLGPIFIVDFERRLVLFAYDDRGMDVVAMDRESLLPIYRQFSDWLLDYDRDLMDARFAENDG